MSSDAMDAITSAWSSPALEASAPARTAASDAGLHLTALREEHLPHAAGLSSQLGWPYREEDWRIAFALGRGIAIENGARLVATALWWPYAPGYASFGMIIVTPAMQGRGLGRALMAELLRQAGPRTVFLNSTREGLNLYARMGFVADGRVLQHQGIMPSAIAAPDCSGMRAARPGDARAILALDALATGMRRTALLEALLPVSEVEVVDRADGIEAFALCRPFGRGRVVGPVVASDPQVAQALIARLASRHAGTFVRTDVSEASGLSAWLEGIGLPQVDHAISMVRGARPASSGSARLFALSNQSFG